MAIEADFVADAFGSMGDKFTQLGAGIASELMPNLVQISEWINEADFTALGQSIGEEIETMVEFFSAIGKGMSFVAERVPGFQQAVWLIEKLASLNPTRERRFPRFQASRLGPMATP